MTSTKQNDEAMALVESIDRDTLDAFGPDRIRLYRKFDLTRFTLRCLDEIERLQQELAWKQEATRVKQERLRIVAAIEEMAGFYGEGGTAWVLRNLKQVVSEGDAVDSAVLHT